VDQLGFILQVYQSRCYPLSAAQRNAGSLLPNAVVTVAVCESKPRFLLALQRISLLSAIGAREKHAIVAVRCERRPLDIAGIG
jgi:hypothetical protein